MNKTLEKPRAWHLLVLSAETSSALETETANLIEHLKRSTNQDFVDIVGSYKLRVKAFKHRRILVCNTLDNAVTALETLDSKKVFTRFQESEDRPVVFMFPGQGAQYVNMGLELYQIEKTFREQVDICSEFLKPHLDLDIRNIIYPDEKQINVATQQLQQTLIAQSALFVIEYASTKLWQEWGVLPQAMIGHSLGEYVAACLAGVFSLKDALELVAIRGRLIQELPSGAMLAIELSEKEVRPFLGQTLSLAAINGPNLCIVSGPAKALEELNDQLSQKDVMCLPLDASHAPHSQEMDFIIEPFKSYVEKMTLRPPQIPYISSVTGTWITTDQATDPNYWARHIRQTVRFSEGLQELFKKPERILLQVGPGRTLSAMAVQHPERAAGQIVLSSLRHPYEQESDVEFILNILGQIWLEGVGVELGKLL
ncbi:Non-ribosomal peptide synthetase component F (plasmid) [Nostoc flagelliforme CCNUN1]|uniref:Non-ribosomal peptide synthetase component F n=1 Tax=Nostoc flagelliforme CCNUN1 TaxID=2038116 RepID=A0A2K8T6F5_9NOSO|nr:acyltransferase domain-containing protein [Nostoc flagelliforme]AUB43286.1 Non-ribosomal peptide synthetase component F [Nostoc flagelliforme CCNUN1]